MQGVFFYPARSRHRHNTAPARSIIHGISHLPPKRVSGYLLYRTKAAPSLAESPVYSYISIQYNDLFYKAMHQGIKPITVPSFNNTR